MSIVPGLLRDLTELLPPLTLPAHNPLVFLHAEDPAYAAWLQTSLAARMVAQSAVVLGRYPAGTLLDGGTYTVRQPEEAVSGTADTVLVDRPCLLVCQHGEWCWGHWLLDMLPKIVLAEQNHPLMFTYALPAGIVDTTERPAHAPGYARSVLESLAAYGIGPGRVLQVRFNAAYAFASLFDLAGISGKHMHPGVLQAMRNLPAVRENAARVALTCVLRAPPSIRPIGNADGIRAVLQARGAVRLDPLRASFTEQAAMFARSDVVVGDLGSNLAGMIYAAPGAGLVTLAPLGWDDDYFAKLFQRLDIHLADIRGWSRAGAHEAVSHLPYDIAPEMVADGLRAVEAARCARPWASLVGDRMAVRRAGSVLMSLSFTPAGTAGPCLHKGFSTPENNGTWSLGAACSLVFPMPSDVAGNVWLEIEGVGFAGGPAGPVRTLVVRANGMLLARAVICGETLLQCPLPAGLLAGARRLEIEVETPGGVSPMALGLSDDTRELGFMFEAMRLCREVAGG